MLRIWDLPGGCKRVPRVVLIHTLLRVRVRACVCSSATDRRGRRTGGGRRSCPRITRRAGPRSPAGKRERNYKRARSRRAALERRALEADGSTNEDAARH
jgi:hypothetical protein